MTTPRSLLLGAALLAAPAALAQQHGDHGHAPPTDTMDHSQMDHSQMGHGGMDHEAMMALHQRMMADPEMHQRMMAMPEMRAKSALEAEAWTVWPNTVRFRNQARLAASSGTSTIARRRNSF